MKIYPFLPHFPLRIVEYKPFHPEQRKVTQIWENNESAMGRAVERLLPNVGLI
jgi:hypothetical protein